MGPISNCLKMEDCFCLEVIQQSFSSFGLKWLDLGTKATGLGLGKDHCLGYNTKMPDVTVKNVQLVV